MKNKEKFSKEIVELACDGYRVAFDKRTDKINSCAHVPCSKCLFFDGHDCDKQRREWAETEYIEKPVISKKTERFWIFSWKSINILQGIKMTFYVHTKQSLLRKELIGIGVTVVIFA